MERREQYDPEDIESLLQERGFDELLEEERAYVLRHLSGRDEYERMRALLLQVQQDERGYEPLDADIHVREHVLQTFRAQQRPQWQVWLNSVGQLFTPGEGNGLWRPALAIAMVLVLFVAGILLIRGPLGGSAQQELAEVRRQKAEEPLPVKAPVADTVTSSSEGPYNTALEQHDAPAQERSTQAGVAAIERPQNPPPAGMATTREVADDQPVATEKTDGEHSPNADAITFTASAVDEPEVTSAPASGYVMTQEDVNANQSMANATGKVRSSSVEPSRLKDKTYLGEAENTVAANSRTLANAPQLLDLLSAGW